MKPSSYLLRIWRWHFYAGLFTIPLLSLLASTGLVYLFRAEIDEMIGHDMIFVEPVDGALSLEQQKIRAQSALPNDQLKSVVPPLTSRHSTAFVFASKDSEQHTVFVRPADGTVLGIRDDAKRPGTIALKIHGDLFAGKIGDLIMELGASWALMLIGTGLYLWLPRGTGSRVWGVLLPRLRATNQRMRWRDFHAVSGFWVSGVLAFFAFTGLFWSGIWGERVVKPWNTFPSGLYDGVPVSTLVTGTLNGDGDKMIPWAVESLPLPKSASGHAHLGKAVVSGGAKQGMSAGAMSLDEIDAIATARGLLAAHTISVPQDAEGVYSVTANAQSSFDEATLHIDQYTGNVLTDIRYANYALPAKVVATSIALHEGRFFGFWNRVLAVVGCCLTLMLTGSATVLWWRRKPRLGDFGAPSRVKIPEIWKGATALVCLFSLAFPAAGASLIVVMIVDALIPVKT